MIDISLNNIDKSEWKKVKFGDIAIQLNKSVNRDDTYLKFYVKGEHMNTEDIHIREHGELQNEYLGPAFIRYFEPGNILYGSRRTYLKKVSVAHFEGITSNTTFVIDANENMVDKRLLPFLMLSDAFTDYSVMSSRGSVNPYVNWKDLANYEFLLPPKDQQAHFADLLWALDDVIEKDLKVLEKLETYFRNYFLNSILDFEIKGKTITDILNIFKKNNGIENLNLYGDFLKGKGISKNEVKEAGYPCIRYGEIYTNHNIIIREFYSFIDDITAKNSFLLKKGDVIFAGSGETITDIGKSVVYNNDHTAFAGGDTIIFRPNKKINSTFLAYLLNSLIVRLQLNKKGTGSSVAHIYPEDLKKIIIPNVSLIKQVEIANSMEEIHRNVVNVNSKIESSRTLQKALINQIF